MVWREDCPKCGADLFTEEYYPSAIGLTCPACGCALTLTEAWPDREAPRRARRPTPAHLRQGIHPAA